MLVAAAVAGVTLAAGCARLGVPDARIITGVVENETGRPVAGAVVRLQGARASTVSGEEGRFRLAARGDSGAKYVTAWKEGFYNGGALLASGDASYRIRLKPLPPGDNTAYRWIPSRKPTDGATVESSDKPCDTCHVKGDFPVVGEWESSAHARSATNPFFLAFFNGVRSAIPLAPDLGYRLDFPSSSGNCAACHVPALALKYPYDADPNRAVGVEREGVFCDLCHKVKHVEVDAGGGRPGVLSIKFGRPPTGERLIFGPFDDSFPGPDTFQPLYKQSRYCAACHNGTLWGVQVYGEFAEWAASDYAAKGVHCQGCHMKPDGKTRLVALASEGAVRRHPDTIASHAFPGRDNEEFMRSAVEMEADARMENGGVRLRVRVALRNSGAGHHVPTGNPMRNVLLLVDARDGKDQPLDLLEGSRIPVWGGEGPAELGNYAGLPGKGYAKVLSTPLAYPADRSFGDRRAPLYPAPHWRRIIVESDNRLPAGGKDATDYVFRMNQGTGTAEVRIRLLHRRTFRSWVDPKTLAEGDVLLAQRTISLRR